MAPFAGIHDSLNGEKGVPGETRTLICKPVDKNVGGANETWASARFNIETTGRLDPSLNLPGTSRHAVASAFSSKARSRGA